MCAGTAAFEQQIAGEIAFDDNRVENAVRVGDRRSLGHERWIDPLFDALFMGHRHAEQFDLVAHVRGIADVFERDRLDAFDVDIVEARLRSRRRAR